VVGCVSFVLVLGRYLVIVVFPITVGLFIWQVLFQVVKDDVGWPLWIAKKKQTFAFFLIYFFKKRL